MVLGHFSYGDFHPVISVAGERGDMVLICSLSCRPRNGMKSEYKGIAKLCNILALAGAWFRALWKNGGLSSDLARLIHSVHRDQLKIVQGPFSQASHRLESH